MDFFRHHPTSAQQHGSPAAESLPFPNLPRCVVGVDLAVGHLTLECVCKLASSPFTIAPARKRAR
jgi:hypothetical protein